MAGAPWESDPIASGPAPWESDQEFAPVKSWPELKARLDAAQAGMPADHGFHNQAADAAPIREAAAKMEGQMAGADPSAGAYKTFERKYVNDTLFGAPRWAEANFPSWLGGQSDVSGQEALDFLNAKDAARNTQHPLASAAGTIGAIGTQIAATPAKVLPSAAEAMGIGASRAGKAIDTLTRVGAGAGVGAGMGAVQSGFESNFKPSEMAQGAKWGAVGGLAGGVLGESIAGALGRRAASKMGDKVSPTISALENDVKNSYAAVKAAGVYYKPQEYKQFLADLVNTLDQKGFEAELTPKTAAVLKAMAKRADGTARTLDEMDRLNRIVGQATISPDPNERRLAGTIAKKLHAFIQDDNNVFAGFGGKGAGIDALNNARAAYAQLAKAREIKQAVDLGRTQAKATYSGGNIDNAIRQSLKNRILNPIEKGRKFGYTDEEIKAIREVVDGTGGRNMMRAVGNKISPTGGLGLVMGAMTGAFAGLPAAAAQAGAGYALKRASRAGTENAAKLAEQMVRMRRAPPSAIAAVRQAKTEAEGMAILKAILAGAGTATALAPSGSQ